MKMIKPRMSKGVAVAAMVSLCLAAWGFNANAGRPDLAAHKTAIASSSNGAALPSLAVDSIISQGSRWENNYNAIQDTALKGSAWLYVDLGATYLVDSVAVFWEHSGGCPNQIHIWPTNGAATPSTNDTGWTVVAHDSSLTYSDAQQMCIDSFKISPPIQTRYVRVRSYHRMWTWGVSIEELKVFGTPVTSVEPTDYARATTKGASLIRKNSGIQIEVNGSANQSLSADIFSPNGQAVRHLSGNNASFWNYKDAFGRSVINGTYLVRVTAAGKTYQYKIIVNR